MAKGSKGGKPPVGRPANTGAMPVGNPTPATKGKGGKGKGGMC